MKTLVVIVACLLGAVLGNQPTVINTENPFCHFKTPMENFNMKQFMGKWFWTMETPNFYSGRGDRCPVTIMNERENGTIAYMLQYVHTGAAGLTVAEGNVWHCSSSQTDGALMVQMPTRQGYWEARWWILGTDYTNWAASYGCWFAPDGSFRGWFMGFCRERDCSAEHRQSIRTVFNQYSDSNNIEDISYENCPNA